MSGVSMHKVIKWSKLTNSRLRQYLEVTNYTSSFKFNCLYFLRMSSYSLLNHAVVCTTANIKKNYCDHILLHFALTKWPTKWLTVIFIRQVLSHLCHTLLTQNYSCQLLTSLRVGTQLIRKCVINEECANSTKYGIHAYSADLMGKNFVPWEYPRSFNDVFNYCW